MYPVKLKKGIWHYRCRTRTSANPLLEKPAPVVSFLPVTPIAAIVRRRSTLTVSARFCHGLLTIRRLHLSQGSLPFLLRHSGKQKFFTDMPSAQ